MPKELKCPACGSTGRATTDGSGAFDVRGQWRGKAMRKCMGCGSGLAIGPFSGGFIGKPVLVPSDTWRAMEKVWEREFGNG